MSTTLNIPCCQSQGSDSFWKTKINKFWTTLYDPSGLVSQGSFLANQWLICILGLSNKESEEDGGLDDVGWEGVGAGDEGGMLEFAFIISIWDWNETLHSTYLSVQDIVIRGVNLILCFFEDFKIYSGLWSFSVSPRCQCVYTHQAGRKQALHQNWQSSEKLQNYKEKHNI